MTLIRVIHETVNILIPETANRAIHETVILIPETANRAIHETVIVIPETANRVIHETVICLILHALDNILSRTLPVVREIYNL